MSETHEQNDSTQEQDENAAPTEETVEELHIVDAMKPSAPAPSNSKPLRYGTRKSKSSAQAPAITNLSSISSEFEEEVVEMDDLPIRANAPDYLIDSRPSPDDFGDEDERPRRRERSRGERPRRRSDDRSAERTGEDISVSQQDSKPAQSKRREKDRPERFGTIDPEIRKARHSQQAQEFRPSRDGRTSSKPERKRERAHSRKPQPAPKKKGIFAKVLSFFTGDSEEEKRKEEQQRGQRQRRRGGSGRRGPDNRQRDGEGKGGGPNRRRRSHSHSRKPRHEGEAGQRRDGEQQNREGGQRRRRRRPRREGQERRPREGATSE